MDINRTIQVTNKGMYPVLSVAQGTNTVKMNFTISDFSIPPGSSAVAYNIQPTGNIVSQICTVSGKTVSIIPPAYYFLHGKNLMQFQLSNGNNRLITFVIEVWCSPDISNPEVVEMSNPTVTQQLLSQVGVMTDRLNNLAKLPEGSTTGDAELRDIRIGYDGTEYENAGEAVRGQIGSLSEEVDDIAVKEYVEMQVEFIEGSYIPYFNQHTITENSNAKYLKILCKSGEKYKIHTKNFYDGRAYALYSGENEYATDYYPGTELIEVTEEIVIPEDVTTLVVNSELSFPAKVEKYVINNKNYYAEKKIMESEIMRNKHEREYFYSSCINLINSENLLPDKGVIFQVGRKYEIIDSPGCYALKSLIPVQEGETYTLLTAYARAVIYDFNLTVIDSKYEGADPVVFTIPTGGAFLSCFYQNSKPISGLYKGNRIGIDFISPNIFLGKTTSINGLNWCAFGDSLTDKNTLKDEESGTRNYVDFIQWSTGLNVTNLGKGGTGYMADNGYQQSFIDRISQIPTDSNIITCFGSFNDASKAKEHIGTIDDDTKDTLYGCLNLFVTGVQNHCPDSIIGLITPTPWSVYNNVNGDSEFSEQYVDAIINIAKKYGLPLLDLYHSSGLRPWDSAFKEKYFRDDTGDGTAEGVHPLQETHRKYIAPQVENFIRSIANTYISISY